MADYHVYAGRFGIYAGIVNEKNPNFWKAKSEVTKEAVDAVIAYLWQEEKRAIFSIEGQKYVLCIQPYEEAEVKKDG